MNDARSAGVVSDVAPRASGEITDTDRLDFLDRCNAALNARYGTNYSWELIINHNITRLHLDHLKVDLNDAKAHGLKSCRDAIDREIRATAERKLAKEARDAEEAHKQKAFEIREAAKGLQQHLFGSSPSMEGNIGMGANELHVYVRVSKKRWRGPTDETWVGFPLIWHYGVGVAKALGARPDTPVQPQADRASSSHRASSQALREDKP